MAYVGSFEIDMVEALSTQLVAALRTLRPAKLSAANILKLSAEQGVYALYLKKDLVYVGKADNLPSRLGDHLVKISGRKGVSLDDMKFKCLYVHPNWTALAPEKSLIAHFSASACDWNGIGFGPHDPGRRREETDKKPDGFDKLYPIQAKVKCVFIGRGSWNVRDLLVKMKRKLPFLLRYQFSGSSYTSGHPNFNKKKVVVSRSGMGARALMQKVAAAVPGWQATVFPSHIIFYKESKKYKYGSKA